MTQQQQPGSTDAPNSNLSDQQSTPNWNVVADKIGLAITNAANSAPPAKTKKDWLSWLNLVATAAVAIAGLVLTAAYNAQSEKIQKELSNFSHALQFAHLEVNCDNMCTQTQAFQITNAGPATASNVTITISLNSIGGVWKANIFDINNFNISVFPRSLPRSINETISDNSAVSKNDTYVVSFNNITPDEIVKISLNLNSKKIGKLSTYNAKSNIAVFASPSVTNLSNIVYHYLIKNYFELAVFDVTATCNNCTGNTLYNATTNLDNISMEASTLVSKNTPLFSGPTQTSPTPQQSTGTALNTYVESDGTISVSYILPKGAKPLAVPDTLYLQINNAGTPNESTIECQPSDCNQSHFAGGSGG